MKHFLAFLLLAVPITLPSQLSFKADGSSTTRKVSSKLGEWKSAQDFGAVCDSSTDNVSAFTTLAAYVNSATNVDMVFFPDCSGTNAYNYSGGLVFTKPVLLYGSKAAVLNYTGTGKAMEFGVVGLTGPNDTLYEPFEIRGLRFTGGATMTHGIYINPWTANVIIDGTEFLDFGNSTAWNIFSLRQGWFIRINNIMMTTTITFLRQWNGIRTQGQNDDATGADSGNSRLVLTNSFLSPFGVTQSLVGLYASGTHTIVDNTTFQNFLTAAIQIGSYALDVRIEHSYFEQYGTSAPMIMYGESSGARTGVFVKNLTVRDCYANVHNTDLASTVHFIGPATASAGLQQAIVSGNTVVSYTAGQPMVVLNNTAGQIENKAEDNTWLDGSGPHAFTTTGGPIVHTTGANITAWSGSDEYLYGTQGIFVQGNMPGDTVVTRFWNNVDSAGLAEVQGGLTNNQYAGVRFTNYQRTQTGQLQCNTTQCDMIGPNGSAGWNIVSGNTFNVTKGMAADAPGFKHKRVAVGCTTAAAIGAACTSAALSWSTAFADANYTLVCTLTGPTGQPHISSVAQIAASFTVTIAADTAVGATGTVDCVGVHD